MQRPTHPRLHVRDARDAHTVFEAVRQGLLQRVERRLNEMERSMYIRSGAIFVWEECDDDLGLKRWTDGRIWSQSRMREPYLFYDERLPPDQFQGSNEQTTRSPTYRFVDGNTRQMPTSSAMSHYDRSNQHPMGLVKQAYSAWVHIAPNVRPKKWHLTAYFTYSDLQNIPTIDHDPILRRITLPQGVYKSGKARSRNSVGLAEEQFANMALSSPSSQSPSPAPRNVHYPLYPSSPRSAPTDPQVSSGHERDPQKPALPPIHSAIPNAHHPTVVSQPQSRTTAGARPAEDQRLIQMLNSRHIM